jgi:hypothetical protein
VRRFSCPSSSSQFCRRAPSGPLHRPGVPAAHQEREIRHDRGCIGNNDRAVSSVHRAVWDRRVRTDRKLAWARSGACPAGARAGGRTCAKCINLRVREWRRLWIRAARRPGGEEPLDLNRACNRAAPVLVASLPFLTAPHFVWVWLPRLAETRHHGMSASETSRPLSSLSINAGHL